MKKIYAFIFSCIIILNIILPASYHYFNNYSSNKYVSFDKELNYHDIFFSPSKNWWKMYGIGVSDLYISEYSLEHPFSDTIEFYKKKGVVFYPPSTITELNLLLNKCTFRPIDKNEAFWYSLFFNYYNNITTVKLSSFFVSEQLTYRNVVSTTKDNSDMNVENKTGDIGIVNAGIYSLFDRTYLVADYAISENDFNDSNNVNLELIETGTTMFEIIDSDSENEIVERKHGLRTAKYDCYDSSPYSTLNIVLPIILMMISRIKKTIK